MQGIGETQEQADAQEYVEDLIERTDKMSAGQMEEEEEEEEMGE